MQTGPDMVKSLYRTYFPHTGDTEHLRNMWYLLQLIFADSHQNFYHCVRVSNYAMLISGCMDISEKDRSLLWSAAVIHDIGKIYTSKRILKKPGPLTVQEFEEIKRHPCSGSGMIERISGNSALSRTVLCHHERYDGKGYPSRLKGEKIPFLSRIISVADAYDAMTVDRVYKKKLSVEQALEELLEERDKQFDGRIVDAFVYAIENDGREVRRLNVSLE